MTTYSFHNFMLPFQWKIKGHEDRIFSEQISLNNINYAHGSNWERVTEPTVDDERSDLYNEKNYFYKFVHDALYDNGNDNSLVRHYERAETRHGNVTYVIDCGTSEYALKVSAINLNLYSTGVGILSFYLYNERYPDAQDVLRINQVGRRLFPPFVGSLENRGIIAHSIEVKGLHGRSGGYREDFSRYSNKTGSNELARFVQDMVCEIARNIIIEPIVDDRMFVYCWYKNDEWTKEYKENYALFATSDKWYEYVFIDELGGKSCQNDDMAKDLLQRATYPRWQKYGSLYGISRYSLVYLTGEECPPYLLKYFETIYVRMAELVLVQKASVLRFSAEVTNISNLEKQDGLEKKVSSLYKEYIRFVNQIHFREISAQDQGIELYQKFYEVMNLEHHVEKLDGEIEELYNYVSLSEDRKNNKTLSVLTWIATIAVPMTVVAGIFGMNNQPLNNSTGRWFNSGLYQLSIVGLITILFVIAIILILKKWRSK